MALPVYVTEEEWKKFFSMTKDNYEYEGRINDNLIMAEEDTNAALYNTGGIIPTSGDHGLVKRAIMYLALWYMNHSQADTDEMGRCKSWWWWVQYINSGQSGRSNVNAKTYSDDKFYTKDMIDESVGYVWRIWGR